MTSLSPGNRIHELHPDVASCINDIKVVLAGSVCVGKTSLFARFTSENFEENAEYVATVSGAYSSKKVVSQEWTVTLHVWDTAGSERFKAMTTVFFRNAKAAIICFDLTTPNSFEEAKHWLREVRAIEPMCRIYLCGTKKDLVDSGVPRAVPEDNILQFAGGCQAPYFETSSKTGENVGELFQRIADEYTADPANWDRLADMIKVGTGTKSKGCCGIF